MGLSRYVQGVRGWRGAGRRGDRTAFVLSGGGVLGAVQVGQLQALLEAGILPDLLVGTSVGALNAAAVAADPTPEGIDRLRSVWSRLRSEDLFPGTRLHRAWQIVRRSDHLFPNDGIRRLVDHLSVATFEELPKPLSVGATNLRSGKERWFEQGSLVDAILASTALPGIFPPVPLGDELYVDGGVVNNVPVSRAVELGATKIYVLTCTGLQPMPRPIRTPLDVLVQAFAHSRAARAEFEVERFGRLATIELLPTFETGYIRFTDPSHSARLMEKAAELAREYLRRPLAAEAARA